MIFTVITRDQVINSHFKLQILLKFSSGVSSRKSNAQELVLKHMTASGNHLKVGAIYFKGKWERRNGDGKE